MRKAVEVGNYNAKTLELFCWGRVVLAILLAS